MPSPTLLSDSLGDWYQLGIVTVVAYKWRTLPYRATGGILRLAVAEPFAEAYRQGFCYVRGRYQGVAWDGKPVIERSTRWYPDEDATVINLQPALAGSAWSDTQERWIELMLSAPRSTPAYLVRVEELA